mmetsp:Transcript_13423/g.38112  ORF Transcript_13423/g.38112 Transcript_13423/m.38112 type:complete len:126 (-) Transcript_13423:381-758(-)|eukprot:CAMPEP_0117649528 /NCGR_PEP_ID=MMETSP0804-20121206/1023_1 /TAXON_ID=1074897 /ORGANISM="Tetraselmis astigmatica, Strain CCMP880" /LENGTH=125 /DNA_ID=CAMNT_0005455277 /DNA_START=381 /DNA_END=758 /DNA_ORIENTATION=-
MPSSKSITSKYVLYVSNVSGDTRTKDIRYEFQRTAGSVYQVERDYKTRSALVEMDRASDAEYAWRKVDGCYADGREWRVDYATPEDFKFFGWKWTEGNLESSRSRSRSPAEGRSTRSDSPTSTKH